MSELSTAQSSDLIAALFSRFQALYGNRAATMWAEADPSEVRRVWGDALAEFEPFDVRYALDALEHLHPDFPPTLFRFTELCRLGRNKRAGETEKLTPPDPRGGSIAPEVAARIAEFVASVKGKRRNPREWARKIVDADARGERVHPAALRAAQEALGLVEDAESEDA